MKTYKSIREAQQQFNNEMIGCGRTIFYLIIISLIISLIIFFSIGCSDDSEPEKIHVITTAPPIEPPIISPPPIITLPPENNPIELSLYTTTGLKFYDGESILEWKQGPTARAESATYSHENILYYLNEYGQTISSQELITVPYLITVDPTNYYIYEHIDPQTALDGGAMFKDYSRFYMNSTEIGSWGANDYITDKIIFTSGDLFARKESGSWLAITGTKTDVKYVCHGLVIYEYDSGTRSAYINGVFSTWSTNFMNGAKYWQKSGNNYYSENGYIWDGATLSEDTGIMKDWRVGPFITGYTEGPVLISAGTREENSEEILYWIECNSGWVIRQVTSTNQMTLHVRLYTGDGLRATGLFYQELLKPVVAGDYLYYIFDAQVYRYDFVSGLNAVFCSGVSEIWGY